MDKDDRGWLQSPIAGVIHQFRRGDWLLLYQKFPRERIMSAW